MKIQSNSPFPVRSTDQTNAKMPVTKSGMVPAGVDATAKKGPSADVATLPADLAQDLQKLALDLKEGRVTTDQLAHKFVDLVVSKRMNASLKKQTAQAMRLAVGNIVGDDPQFVARLNGSLRKV